MASMHSPNVPVSWGELLDKLTILAIKRQRIDAPAAQAHILTEYQLLSGVSSDVLSSPEVSQLVAQLRAVNEQLWEIEDAIREQEAAADFGPYFIRLARSVYKMNDRRAAIKRAINALLDSELVEEKSYAGAPRAMVMPTPAQGWSDTAVIGSRG